MLTTVDYQHQRHNNFQNNGTNLTAAFDFCRMLVAIDRIAFKNMQFPRTLGKGSMPLKPKKTEVVRGKEKTELLTFSALSPNDIDRVTQLVEFERLLNNAYEDIVGANNIDPWVLTDRKIFEEFPPYVLSQVLEGAMMSAPQVLRTYHPNTDALLLALHNPTAKGRVGQKLWKPANFVRHRVPFNSWRISPRLDATPRTLEAAKSGVEISSNDLKRLTTHTMHMFPADHSTVCLRTMSSELADIIAEGSGGQKKRRGSKDHNDHGNDNDHGHGHGHGKKNAEDVVGGEYSCEPSEKQVARCVWSATK